jgi:beta-lactam-binding protein with PASTA domain
MHAARSWLPTAIGMLLLVPPWSGPLAHAVAQSRTAPNTSRPTETPTAKRPPAKTVEPVSRMPQRPSPVPEASQHIPICIVPELTDAASARRDLTGKRLTLGSVEKVETDRHRSGTIVKQSPSPGAKVRCESDVDVWVAVAVPPKVDQPPESVDHLCRVPDLLEDLSGEVAPQLKGAKLRLGTVGRQESTRREGTVVRQVPPRGVEVKCGSAVDVWIAVPPPAPTPPVDCRVPDLIEDLEPAIEAQLARAQLRLRNRTDQESNQRPGTVLRQMPTAGVAVKCGSGVDVWIAVPEPARPQPPQPVSVPPLEGRDQMAATRVLEAAGLHLGAVGRRASDGPRDLVVAQAPGAGTLVQPGTPVQVWLAVPIPVEVPALAGRREADAVAILRDSRLHAGEIRFRESSEPEGVVLEQAPQAGRRVNAETSVDLWLATPIKVLVPDVRGRNQRNAAEALASVGLVVGDVREREDSSPRGTVLDQLPAPQSQVVSGASVALSIAVPRVPVAPPPAPVEPPPAVQPPPSVQPPPPVQPPPQTPVQPETPVPPGIPVQPQSQGPSVTVTPTPVAVASVQVPPVVGLSLNQAFLRLESVGLRPGRVSELRAATTAAGNVTAQFPAAGSAAAPGVQVDLVLAVSTGNAESSTNIAEWIASSPWILAVLAVGLVIAIAGSLAKAKPPAEPEMLPSVSFAPRADPGVQSAYAEDGVLAQSEFRLDSRADAGIQTLHFSDRRVTGEA